MAEDRSWMYTGRQSRESITPEWVEKATEFVERAFRGVPPERKDFGMLCPCARCRNRNRLPRTKYEMQLDLGRNGFMPGYTVWVHHGEGHNARSAKLSDDHPQENGDLDGKKDAAGGGEQVSQGTRTWEMPLLEAYARSKLRKEDQIQWSYQKYLWEQEKTKQQQQQSAPKTKRLLWMARIAMGMDGGDNSTGVRIAMGMDGGDNSTGCTSGSSTAQLAEDEGNNVSVPDPELEDTATTIADGPVANPATTANARGVQIPAGPTIRPKRKACPPGWH